MEEFIIRNYVYRNLCDMLLKMNKLYPELMPDEMLLEELECLKEYVSTLKIKDRLAESTQETDVAEKASAKKPARKSKKEKVATPSIDVTTPLFTFDAAQFQSEQQQPLATEPVITPKKATHKSKSSQEPSVVVPSQFTFDASQFQVGQTPAQQSETQSATTHQCSARVITASRSAMSNDYMSYPANSTVSVYGRQCKNVRQNDQTQFCRIHDKKCEYGIFADEPSEEVKKMCLRKYNRLKEIENNSQALNN